MKWLKTLFESNEQKEARLYKEAWLNQQAKVSNLLETLGESFDEKRSIEILNEIVDILIEASNKFFEKLKSINLSAATIKETEFFQNYNALTNNTMSGITKFLSNKKYNWFAYTSLYDKFCIVEKRLAEYLFRKYMVSLSDISIDIATNGYTKNYRISYPDQDLSRLVDLFRIAIMHMRPFERSHEFWKDYSYTIYPYALDKLSQYSTSNNSIDHLPKPEELEVAFYIDRQTAEKIIVKLIKEKNNPKQYSMNFVMWLKREWENSKVGNEIGFREWLEQCI